MKKLYEEQVHTIFELQEMIGVSHFGLYNFLGKPEKIKNIKYDTLVALAEAEGVEPSVLKQKMLDYAIAHPKTPKTEK